MNVFLKFLILMMMLIITFFLDVYLFFYESIKGMKIFPGS